MRIALILLSIVALLFIGSISYSLFQSWGIVSIPKTRSEPIQWTDIETLRYQVKTEEKIKQLEQTVEELSKKTGLTPVNQSPLETSGGSEKEIIKLSGKFLAKVMPTLTLELIENNGIYGLYIFDMTTSYSTYEDPKFGIKVIASSLTYDTFLKNAKALWKEVYTVNETKTFPFRSFYLNPPKSDSTVRLVLESENQSIALEVSKSKFPTLKKLLEK